MMQDYGQMGWGMGLVSLLAYLTCFRSRGTGQIFVEVNTAIL